MKIRKIRTRMKINKNDFVLITGKPDNTINWNGLMKHCRENMIPLENLPEELVNKFRI